MASFGRTLKSLSFNTFPLLRNENLWLKKISAQLNIARHYAGAYESEAEGKTHAVVLNKDVGAALMIDSYSEVGFRLNSGINVIGPLALFPTSILSWDVAGLADINEDSLSLLFLLEPSVDILVIGYGSKSESTSPHLMKIINMIRKHKIQSEVLPTESACGVFNFLNSEGRFVGALLIPPKVILGGPSTVNSLVKDRLLAIPSDMNLRR